MSFSKITHFKNHSLHNFEKTLKIAKIKQEKDVTDILKRTCFSTLKYCYERIWHQQDDLYKHFL